MLLSNKLEDISWASLKTAHGYADHIPSAIIGLNSESAFERDSAYWKLDNYVVLQSDLYEAAFYVIPFLVELLMLGINKGKQEVYNLLYEIANGSAPKEITVKVGTEEIPLETACYREIGKHIDLYLADVKEKSSPCREEALALLLLYPEFGEKILVELNEILNQEESNFRQEIKETMEEIRQNDGGIG